MSNGGANDESADAPRETCKTDTGGRQGGRAKRKRQKSGHNIPRRDRRRRAVPAEDARPQICTSEDGGDGTPPRVHSRLFADGRESKEQAMAEHPRNTQVQRLPRQKQRTQQRKAIVRAKKRTRKLPPQSAPKYWHCCFVELRSFNSCSGKRIRKMEPSEKAKQTNVREERETRSCCGGEWKAWRGQPCRTERE